METRDSNYFPEHKGIKPTSNRILVYRAMTALSRPVSLSELTDIIGTMDKSSVFRVLSLFASHNVVHVMEDGSGMEKYELCESEDECSISDMHVHFYCMECHQTYCFKTINVSPVDLPEGFTMQSINFMIKGFCPKCAHKNSVRNRFQ